MPGPFNSPNAPSSSGHPSLALSRAVKRTNQSNARARARWGFNEAFPGRRNSQTRRDPGSEGGSLRFKRKDSLELRQKRKWRAGWSAYRPGPTIKETRYDRTCHDQSRSRERERESRYIPNFLGEESTTYGPYNGRHYVQAGTSSSG